MKIDALMLVKKNSKRLKNKNLLPFPVEPMFTVNLRKCKEIFDDVYVSTDSKKVGKITEKLGGKVIMRSNRLCGDTPNIPVYKHAVEYMDCDAFIAVQANSPGVSRETIETCKKCLENGVQEVMTGHKDESIYGSVWGMTIDRLRNYGNPYEPTPECLVEDDSVDIHTLEDYNKALNGY